MLKRCTKKTSIFSFLLVFLSNLLLIPFYANGQSKAITIESELQRLYIIPHLPTYINNSEIHQISSYDRKGGNNDGFEGTYSYLRKNDDGSLVIFEATGKGVIERIWTPTPTDDTLDFYFDGNSKPSYSIRFRDLFSGNVFPFVTPVVGHKVGGFYSYLPIPYSNGCKIVFKGKRILFHQIQYRKYNDGFSVTTFNPQLSVKAQDLLQNIKILWNKEILQVKDIYKNGGIQFTNTNAMLDPGQTLLLTSLNKGGRIVGIELESAKAFEGINNLIDIKVTWDDENRAAIYAPVADFFGFAFGSKSMKSLLMGVDAADRAYCFIPMPFDKSAKVELINRKTSASAKRVPIKARVYYNSDKRNPEKEGKFYARWKREEPALGKPYVFLEGKGRGHYIGTILQSQGKSYTEFTEFFEGDDSTVIDGVNSIHGTGSEDYFNGGWYAQPGGWVERLGAALHGCLDYSLPLSRTGGYRFYISDKLPIQQSIYHSIEHGPENNNRKVDYTSIAMYYAERPIEPTSIPTNTTSKVFIPDSLTFYTRLMDHLTYEGKMALQHGNAVLKANEQGVMNINVSELGKGSYRMLMNVISPNVEGNEVGLYDNKSNIVKWSNFVSTGNKQPIYVGDITIVDPSKPVRVAFRGKNAIELNLVMLVKK